MGQHFCYTKHDDDAENIITVVMNIIAVVLGMNFCNDLLFLLHSAASFSLSLSLSPLSTFLS